MKKISIKTFAALAIGTMCSGAYAGVGAYWSVTNETSGTAQFTACSAGETCADRPDVTLPVRQTAPLFYTEADDNNDNYRVAIPIFVNGDHNNPACTMILTGKTSKSWFLAPPRIENVATPVAYGKHVCTPTKVEVTREGGGDTVYITFAVKKSEWQWNTPIGGAVSYAPVIDDDGNIIVDAKGGYVAVRPDGSLKWNFATAVDATTKKPVLGPDGTIIATIYKSADAMLYALNAEGAEKWHVSLGYSKPEIYPSIDKDGTIVAAFNNTYRGYLSAFNPNGTQKWKIAARDFVVAPPAIASDGTIYLTTINNFSAFHPNGSEKWNFVIPNFMGFLSPETPLIGPDGSVAASAMMNVYAFLPDGSKKWVTQDGVRGETGSAMGPDGTLYFSSGAYIVAINPNDGSQKWAKLVCGGGKWLNQGIGISPHGTLYVSTRDGHVCAVNPDGSQKWLFYGGGAYPFVTPAVGPDGTVYIVSTDGRMFALDAK